MKNNKEKNIVIAILIVVIISLITIIALIYTGILELNINKINSNDENKLSIKIDENLDYTHDATYSYNNKYTEFNRISPENKNSTEKLTYYGIEVEYTNGMQYLSNLKVPYININTYDAGQANKELEQLYLESAKQFDSCAEDKIVGCSQILTYRTYTYDNILSVVVIDSIQGTSPWILNYHTYNFDLTTGNKISYNELLSKLSYSENETLTKIEKLLKEKMDSIYGEYVGDLSSACYGYNNLNNEKINCYEEANRLLENSIKDNNILFFIDNEGYINILAIAYYDGVQNGGLNHYLIKVDNNKNN